ncbi:MAG: YbhB/YbcL family Raf kinase inhibitor-like protein [Ilumatobacteraceae bacterium]
MNFSRRRPIGAVSLVAVLAIVASACSRDGRDMSTPNSDQTQSIAIATTIASTIDSTLETTPSPSFALTGLWAEGGAIPTKYTCSGDSISPPLQFSGVPAGTVTLGLVLTDEDANGVIHWAVANIPVTDTNIPEGALPSGAIQATTTQGSIGYWAPCPPAGQTHHYVITAYAVAQQLEFADGVDAATLQAAFDIGALDIAETSFVSQTP